MLASCHPTNELFNASVDLYIRVMILGSTIMDRVKGNMGRQLFTTIGLRIPVSMRSISDMAWMDAVKSTFIGRKCALLVI